MRTDKELLAGPVGEPGTTSGRTPASDVSFKVVVNGEALNLTLDTGLTRAQNAAVTRNDYPMSRRNGSRST